jgi:hypothetical protein
MEKRKEKKTKGYDYMLNESVYPTSDSTLVLSGQSNGSPKVHR